MLLYWSLGKYLQELYRTTPAIAEEGASYNYRLKEIVTAAPLFNELKILRFQQLYYVSVQMLMNKFYHKILPDIFSNFYICNSDIHSYNTRQHLCYHVPMSRLTQTPRNIRYTGVKTHAFRSSIISYCCSFATYKKSITNVLLSNGNINSLSIMIYFIHAVTSLCYPSNQIIGILSVRCGAVVARSIFFTKSLLWTPQSSLMWASYWVSIVR